MDILIALVCLFFLFKNRLDNVLLGIFILTSSYLGALGNISPFPLPHNVSDSGLVLYICLFIYIFAKYGLQAIDNRIALAISIFFVFLLLSFLVDLFFNSIDIVSIIRTSRHWIFLSAFWIFPKIPLKHKTAFLKKLLYFTIAVTAIMLIEYFFKIEILNTRIIAESNYMGDRYLRAPIPSTYSLFFLLVLLTPLRIVSPKQKLLICALISFSILFSMIRSIIVAALLGILYLLRHNKLLSRQSILVTLLVILLSAGVFSSNDYIRLRFSQAFLEISSLSSNRPGSGNLIFRFSHLIERFHYVSHKPQYIIWGIGNVHEEDFHPVFKIGLPVEGQISQLDTGDIAWSILFLRIGFLGTLLYLLLYLFVLQQFYRYRQLSRLSLPALIYLLLNLLILSFASSLPANGQFWLLPFLLLNLIRFQPSPISQYYLAK